MFYFYSAVKLYELDKTNSFSLLYKTPTLTLLRKSSMKPSLAAQVMSHTVAAGLNTRV
jgi:hypothetical protein